MEKSNTFRCYQDIQLIPDAEFPLNALMSAFFAKLHREIACATERPCLFFPEYSVKSLGSRIRMFNGESVSCMSWLGGMKFFVHAGGAQPVPATEKVAVVRRVHARSAVRERRRLEKREGREASLRIPLDCSETLDLPFVEMNSASTGQRFKLFIEQTAARGNAEYLGASSYGLSSESRVPYF